MVPYSTVIIPAACRWIRVGIPWRYGPVMDIRLVMVVVVRVIAAAVDRSLAAAVVLVAVEDPVAASLLV